MGAPRGSTVIRYARVHALPVACECACAYACTQRRGSSSREQLPSQERAAEGRRDTSRFAAPNEYVKAGDGVKKSGRPKRRED